MKKTLLALITVCALFGAEPIVLSKQQILNWQIKTAKPQIAHKLPLGNFMMEVKAPASMYRTVSLPFEASIVKIYVNRYDKVSRGAALFQVTSKELIERQNELAALGIELSSLKIENERKGRLCAEGIIAQKECIYSQTRLKTLLGKIEKTRSLLRLYSLDKDMIKNVESGKKIYRYLTVRSPIEAVVADLHLHSGSVAEVSKPIVTLLSTDKKILDAMIPVERAKTLKPKTEVALELGETYYAASVKNVAQIVQSTNQTQKVRFEIKERLDLPVGYRTEGRVYIFKESLKVPKIAAIFYDKNYYLFKRGKKGFIPIKIDILSDSENFFYIPKETLQKSDEIVVEGSMVLKGMMEQSDD